MFHSDYNNRLDQYTGACPERSRGNAAGNLTNDGVNSFTYDAEGRATAAAGYTYTYDGDGKRVKKHVGSTGTLYWFGAGIDPLQETDLTGATYHHTFVFLNGQRIARRDASGAVRYYFADHLGSTSVITNETGTIVEESHYYPYGGERVVVDNDANKYKFTGKERDTETQLDRYLYRQLSTNAARWTTPDPAMCSPTNPQGLNRYAYVESNPITKADSLGLSASGWDCFNAWVGGSCNTGGGHGPSQLLSGGEGGGGSGGWNPWIDNCRFLGTPVVDPTTGDVIACRVSAIGGGGAVGPIFASCGCTLVPPPPPLLPLQGFGCGYLCACEDGFVGVAARRPNLGLRCFWRACPAFVSIIKLWGVPATVNDPITAFPPFCKL